MEQNPKSKELQKLEAWFEREKSEHGLKDFKVFPALSNTTVSDVVRETLAVVEDGHQSAVRILSDADF